MEEQKNVTLILKKGGCPFETPPFFTFVTARCNYFLRELDSEELFLFSFLLLVLLLLFSVVTLFAFGCEAERPALILLPFEDPDDDCLAAGWVRVLLFDILAGAELLFSDLLVETLPLSELLSEDLVFTVLLLLLPAGEVVLVLTDGLVVVVLSFLTCL